MAETYFPDGTKLSDLLKKSGGTMTGNLTMSSGVNIGSASGADLQLAPAASQYVTVEAGGIRPYADNAHNCGNNTYRFALVRGVTVQSGDLGFEERTCLKCGKSFEIGDDIVLKVKGLTEWGGTLTIPIHMKCANSATVLRKVIIPKFELKHAFANGKHIIEQHPVKTRQLVKTIQIKKDGDFEIANLDPEMGTWRRVRIGSQIPDFIIGDELPESEVLEEIEIEQEEIVYEEKEIEI